MSEAFELERFVQAQASCLRAIENELRAGEKRSHWMWFVFPQLKGLARRQPLEARVAAIAPRRANTR